MAGDFDRIPLVDISGLLSDEPARRARVGQKLVEAAESVGFLYISGHGIAAARIEAVIDQARAFFDLTYQRKMEHYIGLSRCHRGYVPPGEEVFVGGTTDTKEAFDLALDLPHDDPDALAGNPLLGPNVWPALPGFREEVTAYYRAAFEVGLRMLSGFALGLGLAEDRFTRFVTKPPSQLRLLHYPPDAGAVDTPGIGAHTDYELFTILLPTAPGLEVINARGQWIDAPPIPGTLVVNVGDMLEAWTNGRLVATTHRVRKVKSERYSFPLFFACDYDTVVTPLPELGTPARYPALIAGEHLFAQTAQTFTYLKRRVAEGAIALPDGARALASFGQKT